MKKIDTSNIIENTRRQPFNKASYEHIQEAFQEVFADIMKGLTDSAAGVVVLHGCVDSDAGATAWNISAGAALYNGEVFAIDAFVGSHVSDVPVLSIETTYRAGDPVTFSDNNTFSVHQIRKLKWAMGVSGTGIVDFSAVKRFKDWIRPNNVNASFRNSSGVESTVILKSKIIEIGDWDMDATLRVSVDHGLTATKIRSVTGIIRNDADTERFVIGSGGSSGGDMDVHFESTIGNGLSSTDISIFRRVGGPQDAVDFNSTGYNRGWIYIVYEE